MLKRAASTDLVAAVETVLSGGISDKMMKVLRAAFESGKSAIFVLVSKVTDDKVLERLQTYVGEGMVFNTSLSKDKELTLRAMLKQAKPVLDIACRLKQ